MDEEGRDSVGGATAQGPLVAPKCCPTAKQVARARAREDARLLDDAIARRNAEIAGEQA